MCKLSFKKAEQPEIKLPTFAGHRESKEIPENIHLCFIDYTKAFDCVDHNELWKNLKEMGLPSHLNYFLRNLYAGQEAPVRTLNNLLVQD